MPTLKITWAPLNTTSIAATMAVNSLVTGLIVFRIFTLFLKVKAATTSVERVLGSTGGTKLQHIIFVIIESGMMLLVIQLITMVLWVVQPDTINGGPVNVALEYVQTINEMFNVITMIFLLLLFY